MAAAHQSSALLQSYYLYSALLALYVLAIPFVKTFSCIENPRHVNANDLKHLTPFWLIAALYTTTSPDVTTAMCLFRMFVASRAVTVMGYVTKTPKCLDEAAFAMSISITCYMGFQVVYAYKNAF